MKTTNEQLMRYLSEERDMLRKLKEVVPAERSDYPMIDAQNRMIDALIHMAQKKTVSAMQKQLKYMHEKCEMQREKAVVEKEYCMWIGCLVEINGCLKWLRQDHKVIINNIYLD